VVAEMVMRELGDSCTRRDWITDFVDKVSNEEAGDE
jgi:hypothetical protein